MNDRHLKFSFLTLFLLLGCVVLANRSNAQKTNASGKPEIPKTWVDNEIAALEIPLADPVSSPKHISADYYYRIPVRPIYKSYPVYAPGKEPPGYIERLSKQEPETVLDASKLRTEQDLRMTTGHKPTKSRTHGPSNVFSTLSPAVNPNRKTSSARCQLKTSRRRRRNFRPE